MTKTYGVAVKLSQVSDFEVDVDDPDKINLGTIMNKNDGKVDWDLKTAYQHPKKYELEIIIEDIWEEKEDD